MLASLQVIQEVRQGNKEVLRQQKWLQYLYITKEKNVNLEQVPSLEGLESNPVLSYVEKTLLILDNCTSLNDPEKQIIEQVLIWSDVAKCGSPSQRKYWRERGFQLGIHNIGSAQIYAEEIRKTTNGERNLVLEELIFTLIYTHGLIGQFIRGEVRYCQLEPLILSMNKNIVVDQNDRYRLLYVLNQCIIEAVSPQIWKEVQKEVKEVISSILEGKREQELPLKERIKRLRKAAIQNGENFDEEYSRFLKESKRNEMLQLFFHKTDMWYVESALHDFSLEEFLKIFLLIYQKVDPLTIRQISFEPFMKDIYYDYKGKKTINLYKKRIIEAFLKEQTIDDLIAGTKCANEHVELVIIPLDSLNENISVTFVYSKAGEKLIEFCQEAEKSPFMNGQSFFYMIFLVFERMALIECKMNKTILLI